MDKVRWIGQKLYADIFQLQMGMELTLFNLIINLKQHYMNVNRTGMGKKTCSNSKVSSPLLKGTANFQGLLLISF